MLDNKEFIKLLKAFDPQFQVPCSKTFVSTMVPAEYARQAELLREALSTSERHAITLDAWTQYHVSFLAITVHFLDDTFAAHHRLLGLLPFEERHTAEAIAQTVTQSVTHFSSMSKICSITTDNASNMLKFGRGIGVLTFSCFAHSVQLVVRAACDHNSIAPLISRAQKLVKFFRANSTMQALFQAQTMSGCHAGNLSCQIPRDGHLNS